MSFFSPKGKRPRTRGRRSFSSDVRKRRIRGFLRKVRSPFLILFLTSALSYGVYHLVYVTDYFYVDTIKIFGASHFVNPTDLWNFTTTNYLGTNLLFLNSTELEASLAKRFLGADSIDVKKVYPSGLEVSVQERIPLALLYVEGRDEFYMADKAGYILGVVNPAYGDLPQINYVGDVKIGDFVSPKLIPIYYDTIRALEDHKIKSSSMSFHSDYLAFYTESDIRILLGNDKDKAKTLAALAHLLKALRLEDKNPHSIDLRYDKVVVSY